MFFLGYGPTNKGYKCFDPVNKRLYITMDATFIESEHFYSPTVPNSALQEGSRREGLNWYLTTPATDSLSLATTSSGGDSSSSGGDSPAQVAKRQKNDVE